MGGGRNDFIVQWKFSRGEVLEVGAGVGGGSGGVSL